MPETASATLLPLPLRGLAAELDQVDSWIEAQLRPPRPAMEPLVQHVTRFRGKRLRAAQVLLVGRACGRLVPEHTAVAGIIEMIHAATLVHDDLLDEAQQRRGLGCLHLEWGSHASVLLGDWIYARAFLRSTELEDRRCSQVLAEATSRICAGEIDQNLSCGNFDLPEEDYRDQIDAKTAALYEAGGRLGAHYAGAPEPLAAACARHGLLAGRAFQIADDLLDLTGEEERVGKSLGTDLARGKMTLPLIRLRERLDATARAALAEAFGSGADRASLAQEPFASAWAQAEAECRQEVAGLLQQAAGALEPLPAGPDKEALLELTAYVGARRR